MWVVLKMTKFVLQARKSLCPLSTYSSSELHISWHDGDSFCMDSTQVGVFKQAYQISPLLLPVNLLLPLPGSLASFLKPHMISYMTCWNGALLINKSVDFWYCQISLRATVPGQNLLFFCIWHDGGLRGAFTAIFFEALIVLLAAPSIAFLAVCFVLVILGVDLDKTFCKMTFISVLEVPEFSVKLALN